MESALTTTPPAVIPANLAGSGFVRARRILTLAPGLSGDAIWWQEGRIRAVGEAQAVARMVPAGTPSFDWRETLVTPGFVDGHTHFAMWALNRRRVELAGVGTRDAALEKIAAASPVQGWVQGQGWDANGWPTPPDRYALDALQPGPIYLDSLDVHAAWVNSAALRVAGISRDTPDPFGGRIVRDAAGEPTGLLLERAVGLMTPYLPEPPDPMLDGALQEAQAEAHRLGVTGIHDVEGTRVLETFRRLEAGGRLRLRVLFHPPVEALPDLVARGIRSGTGSEWLTIGGVKMFLDGSLGSRTAWMLDPYAGSRDRGMAITSAAEAQAAVHTAAASGIAATVHAIGDAAVRRALDLLSDAPRAAIPHRIEHFQCVHPQDLDRAAAGGIVASMQPAHLLTDIPLVDRHWGERGAGAYAFRTLLRRRTPMVFGSDVPVASIDPREGVYAAMERRGNAGGPAGGWYPEEKLGFEHAVRGYTAGAALAGGVGHRRGTLAPGQDADLVAWRVAPEAEQGSGDAFRTARAVLTVVAGEVVMQV
ncbi:MAG TPA: amidohydrolase [Gemmatimonadales bacterium]|nr:amidohydrolase [Gemmatimonadales bacterium]